MAISFCKTRSVSIPLTTIGFPKLRTTSHCANRLRALRVSPFLLDKRPLGVVIGGGFRKNCFDLLLDNVLLLELELELELGLDFACTRERASREERSARSLVRAAVDGSLRSSMGTLWYASWMSSPVAADRAEERTGQKGEYGQRDSEGA